MKRGRRFVLGTALLLLSAGGLALLVSRTSEPSAGPPGISDGPVLAASEDALGVPPERGASAPTASYVGRERCAECHLDQVKRHERSHHFWAMAEPTEERVVADFSQQPHVEPNEPPATVRKEGEQFFVKTEGASGKPREYKVRWTFGFEPLQQYLVEFDRPATMLNVCLGETRIVR